MAEMPSVLLVGDEIATASWCSAGMDNRKSVRLAIRGRVQGVGYCAWASNAAANIGVDAHAANRADGSVVAWAVGTATAVDAFVAACRGGPALARVDDVAVEIVPVASAAEAIARRLA